MSQTVKRVGNAFVSGTLTALLVLALASWADISSAVTVGDWGSLKPLLLAVVFGAVNGGLRAIQSLTPVPSPEPEENAGGGGGGE